MKNSKYTEFVESLKYKTDKIMETIFGTIVIIIVLAVEYFQFVIEWIKR